MRYLDKDEAINFHARPLMKSCNGEIRAVDVYIFLSGETISDFQSLKKLGRRFLSPL